MSGPSYNRSRLKIYTKTGDSGETSLFDGTRVKKTDPRVAAYGDVDELHACLGVARALAVDTETGERLLVVQRDLFALGAQLADPRHKIADRVTKAVVSEEQVTRLEGWIDALDAELPPLRHFILAGGAPGGALLHFARTVCRRAERNVLLLGADSVDPLIGIYLNRLSDLLFTMARAVNHRAGAPEMQW